MSDQPVSAASEQNNVSAASQPVLPGADVQVPQMDLAALQQPQPQSGAAAPSSQPGDALAAAASAAAAADQSREAFDKDADLSHLLPTLGNAPQGSVPGDQGVSNAPPSSGPGFFPIEGMFPMSSTSQAGGQDNISVSSQPAPQAVHQNGGFAFPNANPQQPGAGEPFFAAQAASTAGDIPTQPQHQQNQNSSMPLLSKAAAESLASHQFPPSTSGSSQGMNFPVQDNHAQGDMQSSTYDEISRTAPWLLSVNNHQAPPTSAARSTDNGGHPVSSQPAFAPLPSQSDTLPVDQPAGDDDSDEEDDVGDDPNDQDYAPQAPGFMSNPLMRAAARNSMAGQKRTRNSLGGGGEAPDVPVEDVYLPESDEEDEYVQPSVSRKKPRKSGGSTTSTTPGPHRCDFVDESGAVCDTPFKRPYDLARHRETKHGLNNTGRPKAEWICKNCKHNFSRKDALLRHQRVRHHS